MSRSRSLLRGRGSHQSGKVGMVELFVDLVFVFAVGVHHGGGDFGGGLGSPPAA